MCLWADAESISRMLLMLWSGSWFVYSLRDCVKKFLHLHEEFSLLLFFYQKILSYKSMIVKSHFTFIQDCCWISKKSN